MYPQLLSINKCHSCNQHFTNFCDSLRGQRKTNHKKAWERATYCLPSTYPPGVWVVAWLVGKTFWRGECWRSRGVGQKGVVSVKLVADAEIRYLDLSAFPSKEVARLDVSVNYFLIMHCSKGAQMVKIACFFCQSLTTYGTPFQG